MKAKIPKTAHYRIHQMSVAQFEKQFPNEEACKDILPLIAGLKVYAARAADMNVYALGKPRLSLAMPQCAERGYRFSVLVGTIFENTNKPLRDWFRVMHLMLTSKKGISALQVSAIWVLVPTKPLANVQQNPCCLGQY